MANKIKQDLIELNNLGYKVIDGVLYNPSGESLKSRLNGRYFRTCIFIKQKRCDILIHQMVAYQKYGNAILEDGIEVRHKDGNPLNNLDSNILIGSRSDNQMDIPVKKRKERSVKGIKAMALLNTKFSKDDINKIRNFHNGSYKETMKEFNISSKGTLNRILNRKYMIEY